MHRAARAEACGRLRGRDLVAEGPEKSTDALRALFLTLVLRLSVGPRKPKRNQRLMLRSRAEAAVHGARWLRAQERERQTQGKSLERSLENGFGATFRARETPFEIVNSHGDGPWYHICSTTGILEKVLSAHYPTGMDLLLTPQDSLRRRS